MQSSLDSVGCEFSDNGVKNIYHPKNKVRVASQNTVVDEIPPPNARYVPSTLSPFSQAMLDSQLRKSNCPTSNDNDPYTVPPDFSNPFRGGMDHFRARRRRAVEEGQQEAMTQASVAQRRSPSLKVR